MSSTHQRIKSAVTPEDLIIAIHSLRCLISTVDTAKPDKDGTQATWGYYCKMIADYMRGLGIRDIIAPNINGSTMELHIDGDNQISVRLND